MNGYTFASHSKDFLSNYDVFILAEPNTHVNKHLMT
nr:MAG TPA: AAA domain protein [Caudoviricetes sp.]